LRAASARSGRCRRSASRWLGMLIPRIGAATTIGLTVAGQQPGSLLVDHYDLMRLPRRPATRRRLAGVALLLAGVALIQLT
jgi:transporter family-2 protein